MIIVICLFCNVQDVLKNLIGASSDANNNNNNSVERGVLEPTPEFKGFFLNPNLVSLLFKCYDLVRDNVDTAHLCMQSIIQLSTLSGIIFKDDNDDYDHHSPQNNTRVQFLNNFLQTFLTTFTRYIYTLHDYTRFVFNALY